MAELTSSVVSTSSRNMAELTSSVVSTSSSNNHAYHVFINYCGSDHVKKPLATDLYHRLCEHELRVFPDVEKLQEGKDPAKDQIHQTEAAIRTASVHIAILSPAYAESRACLTELLLMLKTGATTIPVFYDVKPSQLRGTELYAEALCWKENIERVHSELIGKWRKALSEVSNKDGFALELESYNSDAEQLVNAIVEKVETNIGHVFINRCSDVQKTFASHLHRRLLFRGQRVFIDKEELLERDEGDSLTPQTKDAIRKASLHIAIFSKKYMESSCCLNELVRMVESKAIIIPVFYGVQPSDIRWQKTQNTFGRTLSKVADIIGFDERWSDDGWLVNDIVERVLSKGKTPISYDVFINHRGPDTKKTLASHLYHRLSALGLSPFLDRENLEKGHELTPQLKHAIGIVSVNIAIFSGNYADSTWCMKELEFMLQSEAAIIPVYYGVEPSDLFETSRDSERVYARALCKLEQKRTIDSATNQPTQRCDPRIIENWRQALSNVAAKRGFNLNDYNGDEGVLLDKVVHKVDQIVRIKRVGQRSNSSWFRAGLEGTALLR